MKFEFFARWRRRFSLIRALAGRFGWLYGVRMALGSFVIGGWPGLRAVWLRRTAGMEEPPPLAPENLTAEAEGPLSFDYQPLFSLLLPLDRVGPHLLRRCLESVGEQLYPHWELLVHAGGPARPENIRLLEEWAGRERRVKLTAEPAAAASSPQRALAGAAGEYICRLHPADFLPRDALQLFAAALNEGTAWDLLYGDEDRADAAGRRHSPWFKPDWSPETLEGHFCLGHFACYRAGLLRAVGGFRDEFKGSADYDLALRFTERTSAVKHIRSLVYHWRESPGGAPPHAPRDGSRDEARRALRERAERLGGGGEARLTGAPGCYDLRYALQGRPLVSLLIATAGRSKEINGRARNLALHIAQEIDEGTAYENYEIIMVHNNDLPPEVEAALEARGCRLLGYEGEFNYSKKINAAARAARGDYLVLLNDDLEIISPDWLENLLQLAQRPGIGAVGAKLWFPDGRIQHAGVYFNPHTLYKKLDFLPGHPWHKHPPEIIPPVRLNSNHNYLAVTGAVLMTPKSLFLSLGGFNENLKITANDSDYCLRMVQAGRRVVFSAHTELYHFESSSRDADFHDDAEINLWWMTWRDYVSDDPYFRIAD